MDNNRKRSLDENPVEYLTNDTIKLALRDYNIPGAPFHGRFGPIEDWDVSRVTDMDNLFCIFFPDLSGVDLGNWDVSNVSFMYSTFRSCRGIGPWISRWDVSKVKNMENTFAKSDFNQPLNDWNVGNVTRMSYMFWDCSQFNQPLNQWNVSNVKSMEGMFLECPLFNQPLDQWDVAKLKDTTSMFAKSGFGQPIDNWNAPELGQWLNMFEDNAFFQRQVPAIVDIPAALSPAPAKPRYFVVETEIFEGREYQVITLPKGMLLCNSYINGNYDTLQKWTYYYGWDQPLENYYDMTETDVEPTPRRYFFPIPLMTNFVDGDFNSMEIMMTTKDLRLLCLISPSPDARRVRHFEPENPHLRSCRDKAYDICLSNKLYLGLRLHGNIAIANKDSLTLFRLGYTELFEVADKVGNAMCFNGDYTYGHMTLQKILLPHVKNKAEMINALIIDDPEWKRAPRGLTCGIPEIVLRPFDFPSFLQGLPPQVTSANLREQFSTRGFEAVKDYVLYKGLFEVKSTEEEQWNNTHTLAIRATEVFNRYFNDSQLIMTCKQAPGLFYFHSILCTEDSSLIGIDEYAANRKEDYDFRATYAKLAENPGLRQVDGATLEMAGWYLKSLDDIDPETRVYSMNAPDITNPTKITTTTGGRVTEPVAIAKSQRDEIMTMMTDLPGKQAAAAPAAAADSSPPFAYRETKHGLPILILRSTESAAAKKREKLNQFSLKKKRKGGSRLASRRRLF